MERTKSTGETWRTSHTRGQCGLVKVRNLYGPYKYEDSKRIGYENFGGTKEQIGPFNTEVGIFK